MPTPSPTPQPGQRKGSVWRTVQAVLWSLLGVRKGSEWQQDGAQVTIVVDFAIEDDPHCTILIVYRLAPSMQIDNA